MSADQETFVSHLIELRERLLRAMLAFTAAFIVLFFWPGAGTIYDFLAQPLMQALPQGAKMIATGVITPFMVPVKVTALVAFMVALPVICSTSHPAATAWNHVPPLDSTLPIHTRRKAGMVSTAGIPRPPGIATRYPSAPGASAPGSETRWGALSGPPRTTHHIRRIGGEAGPG